MTEKTLEAAEQAAPEISIEAIAPAQEKEKKSENNPPKKAAPAKARHSLEEPKQLSNPTFPREVKLSTLQAHRVYGRTMEKGYIQKALFNLGVIMHVIGETLHARQTEETVTEAMAEISAGLDEAQMRADAIYEASQITEVAQYTYRITDSIQLNTPLALSYLELIYKLERLVITVDTLWLSNAIPSWKRTEIVIGWQRSLLGLSNRIINIQRRAHNAAINKGKQQELEKKAITPVSKAISEHDEDDDADYELVDDVPAEATT